MTALVSPRSPSTSSSSHVDASHPLVSALSSSSHTLLSTEHALWYLSVNPVNASPAGRCQEASVAVISSRTSHLLSLSAHTPGLVMACSACSVSPSLSLSLPRHTSSTSLLLYKLVVLLLEIRAAKSHSLIFTEYVGFTVRR